MIRADFRQLDLFAAPLPPPIVAAALDRFAELAEETAIAEAEQAAEAEAAGADYLDPDEVLDGTEPVAAEARTVALDPARFAKATDSVSCGTICERGAVRAPFRFEGREWVGTSRCGDEVHAYRLKPDDGTAQPYSGWDWDTMRGDPRGGYHGMAVKHGAAAMRLVGPEVYFVPGGQPDQAALL